MNFNAQTAGAPMRLDEPGEARTLAMLCARANAARRALFVQLGSTTTAGSVAHRPPPRRLLATS